jgi:hypothetical protein
MGHKELALLLDLLEDQREDLPHVAVIMSPSRVWVKKYAWFAGGPAPAHPKESPSQEDQFFLAVRNPSIRHLSVDFECESRHGRVRFDKSSTSGFKFSETLVAVPQKPSGSVPVARNTRIEIMDTGESSDIIEITTKTFERLASNSLRMLGEPEAESIVLHFS